MTKKGKYLKITRQIGVSYFFTALIFLFSLLLLSLLTRTLSIKEYGVYSIFAATIAVLSVLLTLGLPQYILARLPGVKKFKQLKSFFSIASFSLILLSVTCILMLIFSSFFLRLLKLEGYNFEWAFVVFLTILSSFFALITYYFVAMKKIELYSLLNFCYHRAWVVLLILFYLLFRFMSLKAVFVLWFFGVILSLLFGLFAMREEIHYFLFNIKKVSSKLVKRALAFSVLLVPVLACSWIITFIDRYMINYFIDTPSVGIYTLAYSLCGVIFTLSAVIQATFYPYLAELWNKRKNWSILLNAMLKYSLMVLLPLIVGLLVLRKEIITLISGPKYLAGAPILIILAAYPLFLSLAEIFNKNLLLKEKTKLIAYIYLIGAVINIVLNLVLIPLYGLYGAAYSTGIAYFVVLVLSFSVAKEMRPKLNSGFLKISRILAAAVIMGLAIMPMHPTTWLAKILTIIFGGAIYVLLLFLFRVFAKEEFGLMRSILMSLKVSK